MLGSSVTTKTKPINKMSLPLIALEEHYYSEAIFNALDSRLQQALSAGPGFIDRLRNIDDGRLASMDSGRIQLQVVSHAFTPGMTGGQQGSDRLTQSEGAPSIDSCKAGNDELAAAISASSHPSRFAAFAVLPVGHADESAQELERAVKSLGFVGALIDNHANGKHYDHPAYDVLWAKACALDVPIYLHPTWPSMQMAQGFAGHYPPHVAVSLGGPGFGWHGDVGLHVLKLFSAGVFDRHPTLKIVLGHMGETLPFMLERCFEMSTSFAGGWGPHERSLRTVWDENIWLTTSGCWSLAPLRCILDNTKIERIMYSVDYPFSTNEQGRQWFEQLERSGLLTVDQLAMVAYGNAEALLKLKLSRSTG